MTEVILNSRGNAFVKGDVVALEQSFLGEPKGTRAIVYDEYMIGDHSGVSIITENGVNLGGFSLEEQIKFLRFLYHTELNYTFSNVIQLDRDFEKGTFTFK